MILPAQEIWKIKPVQPFFLRTVVNGMSFGLGPAGYDVRIAEEIHLNGGDFVLASTIEQFDMPPDLVGFVMDKSTWARRGISLFNTVIEPGWRGFLTLEIICHRRGYTHIPAGSPICQIIFQRLEAATDFPYSGKYQDQEAGPQTARDEIAASASAP